MISVREKSTGGDGFPLFGYTCDAEADVAYLPTAAADGNANGGSGAALAKCRPGSYAIVLEPGSEKSKIRILSNANAWKEL